MLCCRFVVAAVGDVVSLARVMILGVVWLFDVTAIGTTIAVTTTPITTKPRISLFNTGTERLFSHPMKPMTANKNRQ